MHQLKCKVCLNTFYSKVSSAKSCSVKCAAEARRGAGNPNYKGSENYTHSCETCGNIFISYSKAARFCSISCNAKRPDNIARLSIMAPKIATLPRKPRRIVGRKNTCKLCSVEFISPRKRAYCDTHNGEYFGGKPIPKFHCIVCGKEFKLPTKNRRQTCSSECKRHELVSRQKGCKSHRWQGGKTSEAMTIRGSSAYADWRKSVFERDNFTCMHCGQRGGKLHADHIKPFSTHPELRLELSNGRTLCKPCHLKTDTWGIKAITHGKAITKSSGQRR